MEWQNTCLAYMKPWVPFQYHKGEGKSMIVDAEIPSINYVGNAEEKSLHN